MLCFIGLQQKLTSIDEFETIAAVLTVHGEVPFIVRHSEEQQYKDAHSESSESDWRLNVVNTNCSRLLPSQ